MTIPKEYKTTKDILNFQCVDCGYKFNYSFDNFQRRNITCKGCEGNHIRNDVIPISESHPHLEGYFLDKDIFNKVSSGSNKKTKIRCDMCGNVKDISIAQYFKNGLSCPICSDNISKPNKFCRSLLLELGISFDREEKFEWSNNKLYDFYIKDLNILIECHGGQHYKSIPFFDFEKQVIVDKEKKSNAIKNGFTFIEIDCTHSDFDFLKESFSKTLISFININNVNWDNVFNIFHKSEMLLILEKYKTKDKYETIKEFSKRLNISHYTVVKILKKLFTLGKIDIDFKEDLSLALSKSQSNDFMVFDLNGKYLGILKGYKIRNKIKTKSHIYSCCSGERRQAYGFQWAKIGDSLNNIHSLPMAFKYNKIIQSNDKKEIIKIYNNIGEACLTKDFISCNISTVCIKNNQNGNLKYKHRGFYWSYKYEPLTLDYFN